MIITSCKAGKKRQGYVYGKGEHSSTWQKYNMI